MFESLLITLLIDLTNVTKYRLGIHIYRRVVPHIFGQNGACLVSYIIFSELQYTRGWGSICVSVLADAETKDGWLDPPNTGTPAASAGSLSFSLIAFLASFTIASRVPLPSRPGSLFHRVVSLLPSHRVILPWAFRRDGWSLVLGCSDPAALPPGRERSSVPQEGKILEDGRAGAETHPAVCRRQRCLAKRVVDPEDHRRRCCGDGGGGG